MQFHKIVPVFFPVLAASTILTVTLPSAARAEPVTAGALVVQNAWARPSIGNAPNSAAYLKITNKSDKADRLVGVSATVSKRIGLHASMMEGGVMKMRHAAKGIVVPAKGAVELKPGGLHVMLMGLNQKLSAGESFDMTLTFERQGEVRIPVEIKKLGYRGR